MINKISTSHSDKIEINRELVRPQNEKVGKELGMWCRKIVDIQGSSVSCVNLGPDDMQNIHVHSGQLYHMPYYVCFLMGF